LRFGCGAWGRLNGDVRCFTFWLVHQLISWHLDIINFEIFDEASELPSCIDSNSLKIRMLTEFNFLVALQKTAQLTQLNRLPAASNLRLVRVPVMSTGKRKLRLVKSQHSMPKETKQFRCGDKILESGIYRVYQVMEVNPAFPARTVPEFIAYAKAHPGKINFASAGTGSVAHVTGEWFKMMAGIDMQHVPYRGAPLALADLLSGQVQVMFDNLPSSIDHIRAGRLRALAVSTPTSLELLPGVPPMAEFLPGFETSAFAGLGAPAGVPREIVDKLNTGVTAALADPKLKARILDLGGVPMPMTPAEFGLFLAAETEKWAKVIRAANIKPS